MKRCITYPVRIRRQKKTHRRCPSRLIVWRAKVKFLGLLSHSFGWRPSVTLFYQLCLAYNQISKLRKISRNRRTVPSLEGLYILVEESSVFQRRSSERVWRLRQALPKWGSCLVSDSLFSSSLSSLKPNVRFSLMKMKTRPNSILRRTTNLVKSETGKKRDGLMESRTWDTKHNSINPPPFVKKTEKKKIIFRMAYAKIYTRDSFLIRSKPTRTKTLSNGKALTLCFGFVWLWRRLEDFFGASIYSLTGSVHATWIFYFDIVTWLPRRKIKSRIGLGIRYKLGLVGCHKRKMPITPSHLQQQPSLPTIFFRRVRFFSRMGLE